MFTKPLSCLIRVLATTSKTPTKSNSPTLRKIGIANFSSFLKFGGHYGPHFKNLAYKIYCLDRLKNFSVK